jgi:hypothetical protein
MAMQEWLADFRDAAAEDMARSAKFAGEVQFKDELHETKWVKRYMVIYGDPKGLDEGEPSQMLLLYKKPNAKAPQEVKPLRYCSIEEYSDKKVASLNKKEVKAHAYLVTLSSAVGGCVYADEFAFYTASESDARRWRQQFEMAPGEPVLLKVGPLWGVGSGPESPDTPSSEPYHAELLGPVLSWYKMKPAKIRVGAVHFEDTKTRAEADAADPEILVVSSRTTTARMRAASVAERKSWMSTMAAVQVQINGTVVPGGAKVFGVWSADWPRLDVAAAAADSMRPSPDDDGPPTEPEPQPWDDEDVYAELPPAAESVPPPGGGPSSRAGSARSYSRPADVSAALRQKLGELGESSHAQRTEHARRMELREQLQRAEEDKRRAEPGWVMRWSAAYNRPYWVSMQTRESVWELPKHGQGEPAGYDGSRTAAAVAPTVANEAAVDQTGGPIPWSSPGGLRRQGPGDDASARRGDEHTGGRWSSRSTAAAASPSSSSAPMVPHLPIIEDRGGMAPSSSAISPRSLSAATPRTAEEERWGGAPLHGSSSSTAAGALAGMSHGMHDGGVAEAPSERPAPAQIYAVSPAATDFVDVDPLLSRLGAIHGAAIFACRRVYCPSPRWTAACLPACLPCLMHPASSGWLVGGAGRPPDLRDSHQAAATAQHVVVDDVVAPRGGGGGSTGRWRGGCARGQGDRQPSSEGELL